MKTRKEKGEEGARIILALKERGFSPSESLDVVAMILVEGVKVGIEMGFPASVRQLIIAILDPFANEAEEELKGRRD